MRTLFGSKRLVDSSPYRAGDEGQGGHQQDALMRLGNGSLMLCIRQHVDILTRVGAVGRL